MEAKYRVERVDGTPIPDDEPCFVLRAQDEFAEMAVGIYAQLVREFAPEVAVAALDHAERIADWPRKKIPD